jgi:hypothetical protein
MKDRYEEGDECPCGGIMKVFPTENCSCHISAPCNACVENEPKCDKCQSSEEEIKSLIRTGEYKPTN